MRDSDRRLIMGVDGGGSGTTVWLALRDDPNRVVGRGESGPSNLRAIGLERATANLSAAIANAFADARLAQTSVDRACLAMAGVDRDDDRSQLQTWAQLAAIAQRVIVTNDALPVLYAAHPSGFGVALIAGTGSLCLGRDQGQRVVRSGGWGHLLGDEGSAYWIAMQALQAVARSADSRAPATQLTQRALQHYGCNEPHELISSVYAPGMDRTALARFAEAVFDSARLGDAVAQSIIDSACVHLASMVRSVEQQLYLDRQSLTLAITGGVLLNQPELVGRLAADLNASAEDDASRPGSVWSVVRVADPVAGAIRMATLDTC